MDKFSSSYRKRFQNSFFYHDFSEKYKLGDDLSRVDPFLTAKRGEFFVKKYHECRDVDLIFVLDVSGSQLCGRNNSKLDSACEYIEKIRKLANFAGDKVGFLAFCNRVEKYIEPSYQGIQSIKNILKKIQCSSQPTNPLSALSFLKKILKNPSVIFWISDFIYSDKFHKKIIKEMCLLSRKHDLICLQITDVIDTFDFHKEVCFFQDIELGSVAIYKGNHPKYSQFLCKLISKKHDDLRADLRQVGIKFVQTTTIDPINSALKKCLDKHLA